MVTRPCTRALLLVGAIMNLRVLTSAAPAFIIRGRSSMPRTPETQHACAAALSTSRVRRSAPAHAADQLLISPEMTDETLAKLNTFIRTVEETAQGPPLAAFDADGTLWETDACIDYMEHMESTRGWSHLETVHTYEALLKAVGKERAYGYCAELFDGMPLDMIERTCAESYHASVRRTIFPEMKQLVGLLKSRGWEVAVVTASPTWVIIPGAIDFGLREEDVIGIDVEVIKGRATNRLKHPLSFGPGKPTRLRMVHPASRPLSLAAGNSGDDFALLGEVGRGGLSMFVDSRAIRGTGVLVGEALKRDWLVHTPRRIRGRAHRV